MKLALPLLLALASTALARWPEAEAEDNEIQYSAVRGYFLQDEPDTNPSTFDYVGAPSISISISGIPSTALTDVTSQAAQNFGLLNRTYPTDGTFDACSFTTQWERFARWVDYLNSHCRRSESVRFKVLVMGRHGQGYHNAAESYYGTPAWNVSLSPDAGPPYNE